MNNLKNNKKLLYDLYVSRGMSLSKIAALYSVSSMTIRAWLIKNGIKTRESTQTIYRELKETDFSLEQKSIIIGSVLGDGSLIKGRDCKNARFTERHSEHQKGYLIWKKNILKPFVKSKLRIADAMDHVISGVKCRTSKSYSFTTISHPYLTKMRDLFYPSDGRKTLPDNLPDFVDGLAFMVWLCDDGSFTYDKKRGIYRIDLHTESFTYKENVFLINEVLRMFFDGNLRINSRMYKSGKAYYICFGGKDKVIELVHKLYKDVPDCIKYKFRKFIT